MQSNLQLREGFNFKNFLTIIIVLSPLFLQYSFIFPFVLFPEFFFILSLSFIFFKKTELNYSILTFSLLIFLYIFSLSAVKYFSEDYISFALSATTSFRLLFYLLIVVFFSSFFLRDYAAKLVVYVAAFNSIYGLAQFGSYNVFNITLPWYLPFLNVQHGKKLITDQDYIFEAFGFRFSGLFSEPAHFSQYIGFAFIVLLFYKGGFKFSSKTKFFTGFVFSIALLLSASGTGFFVILFLFGVVSINFLFNNFNLAKFSIGLFFVSIALVSATTLIMSNDLLSFGVQRILNFDDNASFYVRIIRPLVIYDGLDSIDKIFGVGYGNYSNYIFHKSLYNTYELSLGFAWSNSLGVFLVGSGLVGFILINFIYLYAFIKSDFFGKIVILYIYFHFFFSDLPHTIFFVCFFIFAITKICNKNVKVSL